MKYKVWIHVEEINESKDHYQDLGLPYQIGVFKTEKEAVKYAEDAVETLQTCKPQLQEICQTGLKFLDSLPETELRTERQNRIVFRKMLKRAIGQSTADATG